MEKIREASAVKQAETAKSHTKTLAKNKHRISELDMLYQRVYEDSAIGKLNDDRFEQLSASYEREQAELKTAVAEMEIHLAKYEQDSLKADSFIEIVKRYTEFSTLTNAMLNEFVEKIIVHEADKTGSEREQQVDIHLNFIGHFEIPQEEAPPLTADELAKQEKRKRRLEYQREANRRWYAKKKQEAEW